MSEFLVPRDRDAAELPSHHLVRSVSANLVYNLPLFETYLVIDCRGRAEYDSGHIASALNYPPCEDHSIEQKAIAFENFAIYASSAYINERWNPIVLYGSPNDPTVVEHMNEFCLRLIEFISSHSNSDSLGHMEKKQRLGGLFANIAERTQEIWILEGGYERFSTAYPPLCVVACPDDPTGATTMRPLPYHIQLPHFESGIFVGSRAVDWKTQLFQQFGIHSMILDLESFHKFSPALTECMIETMICSLPDHLSNQSGPIIPWSITQLYQFLDSSTQFIQDCLTNKRGILIQLYGRSHSAMILIAWFMRYSHLSYDESYQKLQQSLPRQSSSCTSILESGQIIFKKELEGWEPGRGGQNMIQDRESSGNVHAASALIPRLIENE